ncbi:uncharacterized protein LOC144017354 isoform X2 [Festucalex cinctus]
MTTPLLLGIFIGLWAVDFSTQVNSVTQIPIKSEEDVLREAETDGFLVEQFFPLSLRYEPRQENPTTQQSNQTSSGTEDSRNQTLLKIIDASTLGDKLFQPRDEGYSTTSERASSSSNSSTTLNPHSDWTSNATQSSNITEPSVPSRNDDSESYSGSGDSEILDQYPIPQTTATYTGGDGETTSFIKIGNEASGDEDSGSGSGFGMPKDKGKARILDFPSVQGGEFYQVPQSDDSATTEQHKGHVTPDWVIILGFVVGVAALVMLCLAIATRDKWNVGPRQASNPQTKVDSSQQQKAENEAFLRKDAPKENGKAVEYTVIPLDDLTEN